jgi:methylenetetrahydrofolate dehydrogenase (NADP+)/methenyltetrahydrofolate cyclohydrolase
MAAKIIDGRAISERIKQQVAQMAGELIAAGRTPKLAAVQVGEDPASRIYTRMQQRSCKQTGIEYELINIPSETSRGDLVERIGQLNCDDSVTALILQMPLPQHLDPRDIQTVISPKKDAESVHPSNMGRLFFDDYMIAPCTPAAAVALLKTVCPDLTGKEVVIVGHSEIVGKPIAAMLLGSRDSVPTVTVCHVATRDLKAHTSQADVVIVATGVAQSRWLRYKQAKNTGDGAPAPDLRPLITPDHLRTGAVVIDVAVNRIPKDLDESGRPIIADTEPEMATVGDVDFAGAVEKVAAITPVPGGVGPVTVAMLLKNTITCARLAGGEIR